MGPQAFRASQACRDTAGTAATGPQSPETETVMRGCISHFLQRLTPGSLLGALRFWTTREMDRLSLLILLGAFPVLHSWGN